MITNTMMTTHTTCTQGLTYMKPDFTNFFGKTLHEIAVSSSVQEVQDQPSLCETVMFNKDGTATHQWLTKEPPTSTTVKEGETTHPLYIFNSDIPTIRVNQKTNQFSVEYPKESTTSTSPDQNYLKHLTNLAFLDTDYETYIVKYRCDAQLGDMVWVMSTSPTFDYEALVRQQNRLSVIPSGVQMNFIEQSDEICKHSVGRVFPKNYDGDVDKMTQ